ncbi:penicillin acylase family protein [Thalassotalea euphylliae]|uniref:penicillin acylase family protein n=1 Tax=Thalassotalea euphylliae TaxID=1655234 RepID=UPI0036433771
MKNLKQLSIASVLVILFLLATVSGWIYSRIDSALPKLDGKVTLFGLTTTAQIERDENGFAMISAENRNDAAMALGFVHAQERFFQMDLLRRNSAGELSSLFGEVAIDYDKKIRTHRFRERARDIIKQMEKAEFDMLQAYTRGVNQGLERLGVTPFEYLLLRQTPVLWQEEDTVLAVLSMYLDLQESDGNSEISAGIMARHLPKDVFDFLTPQGSHWDAAIDDTHIAPASMPNTWPVDLHEATETAALPITDYDSYGSNNWAVSGARSTTGAAIVANDMHLGIRVPNTWFRASITYRQNGEQIKVTGASLPGTPNIVVGSNGSIAWGFTNSYGDYSDVIVLKTNEDKSQYLTPDGYQPFSESTQMIAIKGKESTEYLVRDTIWGPVIGETAEGELLAYRWVAHDINAVNLTPTRLETAKTVEQAFAIAATAGIPAQNMMVGDAQGNIGWTIMGPIPTKQGDVGQLPQDWSTGENGWTGYLKAEDYPQVYNPEHGRLWTANSRIVGDEMYAKLGNGGYALGARAQQIKQRLFEREAFSEQDLLNIALDSEALFMKRWQTLILQEVLTDENLAAQSNWQQARAVLDTPELFADIDSVAYRLAQNYRHELKDLVFASLSAYLTSKDENYTPNAIKRRIEVPLWELVSNKPEDFLPDGQRWSQVMAQAMDNTLEKLTKDQPLEEATWGLENAAKIEHPMASSIPLFGKYLNMPADPLPGDTYIPRVDGAGFGASERMVVSPGNEESGIFHMPTSQAGHPWSPYFGKGHQDWVQGKPSPFLPGEAKYKLTLLSY